MEMKKAIITIYISMISLCNAQVNLNSSLTACYALNGNANEPINNLTGTLSAVTATVDRLNNPNSALSFNGSAASYIVLPDDPLLKSTTAMSFGGWIKTNTLTSQYLVMTRTSATGNFEAYDLVINFSSGQYHFRTQKGNGGNTIIADGTTVISINTWYHVFVTMDNSDIKIYVNGVLEQSVASTFAFSYMTGKNVILGGTNESSFNLPFNGSLDNFRFYNRTLNSSEINQLYTSDPSCLPPPVASFTASAQNVCYGDQVTFTDLSTNNPTSWNWQFGSGASPQSSSLQNPIVNVFAYFTATLVSSNSSGASNAFTMGIGVNPNPIVVAVADRTIICKGESAALTANGAVTYFWVNTSQVGTPINVTPSSNTNYTVIGTDANGCKGTTIVLVKVSNCVSLFENSSQVTKGFVYPNPGSEKFFIDVEDEHIRDYLIYDALGNLIQEGKLNPENKNMIDLSDQPKGIYFLRLKNEDAYHTIKVIKE
jgi:PKD repeat protein